MKIAVTGSTGLIASALIRSLRTENPSDRHTIVRLVRREPAGPDEIRWDPEGRPGRPDTADLPALAGFDAVVHLAGAGIGDRRWSEARKRLIRESRTTGTRTLTAALARLDRPPRVLVSGSAIGFYGDTADRAVDEDAAQGTGFLAELVRDWEAAAAPAAAAGIRVVHPRTGLVLAREGGLLGRLLPLFRLGLGGRLGTGRQWMSWITLPDQVAALRFLIEHDVHGPVNLTAPAPVDNAGFTRALAAAVHRPAPVRVPAAALRVALGGFADEGVLISQRVLPARLTGAGFSFRHGDLGTALDALLSRNAG